INGPVVLNNASALPGFTPVAPATEPDLTNPTTIYFSGANLGISKADILNARLEDQANVAPDIPLTVVDVRDTSILFTVPNQTELLLNTNYRLAFDKVLRYPDGTAGTTPVPFTSGSAFSESFYATAAVGTTAITNVSIPQLQ